MPVVAVLGGDNRVGRAQWPQGYTIRTYQSQMYGGAGESTRLRTAVQAGGIDAIVVLTRWVGHRDHQTVKGLGPPVHLWSRGVGELARELKTLVAPERTGTVAISRAPRFCPACNKYFIDNAEVDGVADPDAATTEACATPCVVIAAPPAAAPPAAVTVRSTTVPPIQEDPTRAHTLAVNRLSPRWSPEEEEALRLASHESKNAWEFACNLNALLPGTTRTAAGIYQRAVKLGLTGRLSGFYHTNISCETLAQAIERLAARPVEETTAAPPAASSPQRAMSVGAKIDRLMYSEPMRVWSTAEVVEQLRDENERSVRKELNRSFERVEHGKYRRHGSHEAAVPAADTNVGVLLEMRLAAIEESLATLLETTLALAQNVVYLRQRMDAKR